MAETMSVRIPEEQLQQIDKFSKQQHKKRADVLREILDIGLRDKQLEYALTKFQRQEATAWKAARMAGIPLTAFLDILKERNLLFHYTLEDLEQDMATAK